MTNLIGWPEAQRICDIPEVREALDKFAADAHEENMLAMVSAIMGHAVTQGRAAGLEEEREAYEQWVAGKPVALPLPKQTNRWDSARVADYNAGWNACRVQYLFASPTVAHSVINEREAFDDWINQGHRCGCNESMWKAWQARAALIPTPYDAGKDDARDAARYRFCLSHDAIDPDGYEIGMARVKWNNDGSIASLLWCSSDGREIDAAMNNFSRKEVPVRLSLNTPGERMYESPGTAPETETFMQGRKS